MLTDTQKAMIGAADRARRVRWQDTRREIIEFLKARLAEDETESRDAIWDEPYPESWANVLAKKVLVFIERERIFVDGNFQIGREERVSALLKLPCRAPRPRNLKP